MDFLLEIGDLWSDSGSQDEFGNWPKLPPIRWSDAFYLQAVS